MRVYLDSVCEVVLRVEVFGTWLSGFRMRGLNLHDICNHPGDALLWI